MLNLLVGLTTFPPYCLKILPLPSPLPLLPFLNCFLKILFCPMFGNFLMSNQYLKTRTPHLYPIIALYHWHVHVVRLWRVWSMNKLSHICVNMTWFPKNSMVFWKNKSTGTNLLSCLQDWQLSIKHRKLIDIVYLDFKKAFDSLVHSKILVKLSCYGIGHELLEWIHSFLTGRTQRVIVDNVLSEPIAVGSGVVQGSVLGPLVFILFINDIVDCLDRNEVNSTSCCIFADDLKLYSSYESTMPNNSLTNTIRNIENWVQIMAVGHQPR